MKKFLLGLLFFSSVAIAAPRTPALEQYMQQLDCTTANALDQMANGVPKAKAASTAAATCVPQQFVAEQRGLPSNVPGPTRENRLASLADSVTLRLDLCERTNAVGPACLKLFQNAE